ncbi:MAG: hypothetical protein E7238_00130 [Sarcina sp.]|nr:hypothetical protein [Sarcina sp.]
MKIELATLVLVIRGIVLIIAVFLAPAAKAWLNHKTENAKMERIKEYARQVVAAAEQVHKKVQQDDPTGSKRLKYATDMITRMTLRMGIALSSAEINALIQAAVYELNRQSADLKEGKDGNQ